MPAYDKYGNLKNVQVVSTTIGSAINAVSAGTEAVTDGTVIFSNSNGVSFGANGHTITASVSASSLAFSNSNNVTFGIVAGTVTASASFLQTVQSQSSWTASAGTRSETISQLVFSNSNGVSFGLTGGTITASAGGGGGAAGTISAGTASVALGQAVFSNSNGVSFGLSGSTVTATVATNYQSQGAYLTTAMQSNAATISNIKISAGTLSQTRSDLTFSNSNGISFGLETNGIITGTVKTDYQSSGAYLTTAMQSNAATISNINVSGGTTSNNLSAITFSNSNGVSFGLNGSTITGSVPATSSLSATGAQSISVNGSTISIGVPYISVTADNGSSLGSLSQIYFQNSNNHSFGLSTSNNGSATLTASYREPSISYFANINNWVNMVTGASAIVQTSGASLFIQPFVLYDQLSASYLRLLASYNDSAVGTAGTTQANTTFSVQRFTTFGIVLYSQGTGASSRSIQSMFSTSAGLTGFTQYSAGNSGSRYTVTIQKTYPALGFTTNNYTTSYAVSSGSIVISSDSNTLFTGNRFLDIPFATSLSQGLYWIGIGASTSSASNSSNISFAGTAAMPMSINGVSQSNISVGILGAVTSASDYQLFPGLGVWTTNANIISKDSIGLNSISQVASNPQIPFQLVRFN